MSSKTTKRLVPDLRFPEFRDAPEWQKKQLEDLISTVAPPKKIATTAYLVKGEFPIVDQGQSHIAGWTNDQDSLIKDDLPLIVFGDHTCALKLVKQPFAQGADGIKVIKANHLAITEYVYHFLRFKPVVTEEYKRHFSILKTKTIAYPEKKSGEQKKISDCLSSIDDLITAEAQKIKALKAHKKGLMQQLFPSEGQMVPRLRFAEFQNGPNWNPAKLGEVSTVKSGGTPSRSNPDYWDGTIPWVTTSLIDSNIILDVDEHITKAGLEDSSAKVFPKHTILMAMYGQGKTRGKVAILGIDAATNQACAAIILHRGMETRFVFHNLVSRYEEIRKLSNPGGQENLSAGLIESIPLCYPKDIKEQRRIADCLSTVDAVVSAHLAKHKALNALKKGLMQRLFPPTADGEA